MANWKAEISTVDQFALNKFSISCEISYDNNDDDDDDDGDGICWHYAIDETSVAKTKPEKIQA